MKTEITNDYAENMMLHLIASLGFHLKVDPTKLGKVMATDNGQEWLNLFTISYGTEVLKNKAKK